MEKVNLMEMTLREVRDKGKIELSVLPWGSCEPHNLHLPYGTDTFAATKIAEISAKKAIEKGAKVIVLPTIPIGVNSNSLSFPLTLHLAPTTQLSILKDIIWSLENHKIYKLLILNSHGGNDFKPIIRELYGKTKVWISLLDWWNVRKDVIEKVCEDKGGEHANEAETSWMMYLYPELVHLEWADDGKVNKSCLNSIEKREIWITRPWHLLTKNSGYGNPKKATFQKGKEIVEKATDRIAEIILEISDAKIDERFPY